VRVSNRILSAAILATGLSMATACGDSRSDEQARDRTNRVLDTTDRTLDTADRAAAGDDVNPLIHRWRGQTEFVSRMESRWWPWRVMRNDAAREGAESARSVTEADIFRHDAARRLLFTLNTYRGLQVIDLATPDAPRLLGHHSLGGEPIEMLLHGTQAVVLLNEPSTRAKTNGVSSVVRVYDVSDPSTPRARGEVEIHGWLSTSAMLVDEATNTATVYAVASRYEEATAANPSIVPGWATVVTSIRVDAKGVPHLIGSASFPGDAEAVKVTSSAAFVASYSRDADVTTIQYVDIKSLEGRIVPRGTVRVGGRLQWGERGELQLDVHDNVLRVASELRASGTGEPLIRVTTIDAREPEKLARIAELDVGHGHRLLAVRFEGPRAYLFHMVQVDPLEVLDLSDPARPVSMGMLRIDGWVNHIEVRGQRLLTLGVDTADSRMKSAEWRSASNGRGPRPCGIPEPSRSSMTWASPRCPSRVMTRRRAGSGIGCSWPASTSSKAPSSLDRRSRRWAPCDAPSA
jgi:hypothetical protein